MLGHVPHVRDADVPYDLGRVKTLWGNGGFSDPTAGRMFIGSYLCPDCRHEPLDSHDVHRTGKIIGQHTQGHF